MSSRLSRLYATEISRLQKVAWLEHVLLQSHLKICLDDGVSWYVASKPASTFTIIVRSNNSVVIITTIKTTNFLTQALHLMGAVLRQANATFSNALSVASLPTPIR